MDSRRTVENDSENKLQKFTVCVMKCNEVSLNGVIYSEEVCNKLDELCEE